MATRHKHNWTDKKKIEVVTSYLALGKAPMVEAVTGVPSQTIRIWKMQTWWKDLCREIQTSEDQELDGKLTKIIDKTLDVINDRLTNGEFILDSRSGTVKRVPVKLRDTHRVTSDLLDKRNVLRGKPTSITERVSTDDVLKRLALQFQEFTKFQKTKLIEGDITDALYNGNPEEGDLDAVYAKRKTGLQDGEREVQFSSTDKEKTGSPEQSSSGYGEENGSEYNGGCGSYSTALERGQSESPLQLESSLPQAEQIFSKA